jgi:amidase
MGEVNRQNNSSSDCAGKPADLVMMNACALSRAIRCSVVSCCEVMETYLNHIDRLNPLVNAIIVLADRDKLMAQARQRDDCLRRGEYLGWMHGFPVAINCPVDADVGAAPVLVSCEDVLPAEEERMSARLLRSGGIVIGTANSWKCGPSGNTEIGIARNAYDQAKTAGGSGAAVALALRMVPVAEASDDAGPLRIAAAFNNVFGFRPSARRMPDDAPDLYSPVLRAVGPMARTVADIARIFSVQQGYDRLTSIFMAEDWSGSANPLRREFRGMRVAWLGDLDGYLAIGTDVMDVCERALAVLELLGCRIDRVCPNYPFDGLSHAWLNLWRSDMCGPVVRILRRGYQAPRRHEAWCQIEKVSAYDVYNALIVQLTWSSAIRKLFATYEYLVLPGAQVFPFDATVERHSEIGRCPIDSNYRCRELMVPVTMSGCPVITVPVGFNDQGLPMGVQIMSRHGDDLACLQLASAYEEATDWINKRPPGLLGRIESKCS